MNTEPSTGWQFHGYDRSNDKVRVKLGDGSTIDAVIVRKAMHRRFWIVLTCIGCEKLVVHENQFVKEVKCGK